MPKRIQSRLAREKHWNSREQSLNKEVKAHSAQLFPMVSSHVFLQSIHFSQNWMKSAFFQGENHRNHFLVNIFPGCPSTAPAPPAARRGLCYRRVVPSALRRLQSLRQTPRPGKEVEGNYDIQTIRHMI